MTRWSSLVAAARATVAAAAASGLCALGAGGLAPARAQVGKPAARQAAMDGVTIARARPATRNLARLPREAFAAAAPFAAAARPLGVSGYHGPARAPRATRAEPSPSPHGGLTALPGVAPQGFGAGQLSSIYHYSDYLVDPELDDDAPWRWAGRFTFVAETRGAMFCSAALISSSIMLTAGHCVHQGGGFGGRPKERGWIKSGTYTPAFRDGRPPYGSATASHLLAASGWYNAGELDAGHDVALVVLNKRAGTQREIGADTGWFGFCHTNCLQPYSHLSQIGYPANYYGGGQMTQSEHLERSNSRDFLLGSGMRGGSSGGPHVANLGEIVDSSRDKGQFTPRNWIFAVTSWGYASESLKLQGASPLSGPNNGNKFKELFNAACAKARALHGPRSCTPL